MTRSPRWAIFGFGLLAVVSVASHFSSTLRGQAARPAAPPTIPVPAPIEPDTTPRLNLPQVPPRDPMSYRDVVKKVLPAVVSLEAKTNAPKVNPRKPVALPPGVPEEFRRFFVQPAPDDGDPNLGTGSGVIIDSSGVILTNHHVVEGADFVEVQLHDGRVLTTKTILVDPKTDLAVIRVQTEKPLPALELGDSDLMEVGDRVLAVGAPFGLSGSVTHGIISAKSRNNLKLNQYEDFLQTDAAINPGNSGGPLVNIAGQVIGINSAIKTRSGGFQGVGLAISSSLARDVAGQLLKHGVVHRGYLGLSIRELDEELANRLGLKNNSGVVVTRVQESGPAAKAGLQPGDVITKVAGTAVSDLNTMPRLASRLPVNEKAELIVIRDGKPASATVLVEAQPEDFSPRAADPGQVVPRGITIVEAGLTVTDLTPEAAKQLGYPAETKGAVIIGVERGGAAAAAGITRGSIVVRVDKTAVTNAKQFIEALSVSRKDRGALLHLARPNGDIDFVVLKIK